MVKYIRNKCSKIFVHKGDYERHLNRINPCNNSIKNINNVIVDDIVNNAKIAHICEHCNKRYTTHRSLMRHIKIFCKQKIKKDDKFIKVCNELTETISEVNKLKQEIEILKKAVKNNSDSKKKKVIKIPKKKRKIIPKNS